MDAIVACVLILVAGLLILWFRLLVLPWLRLLLVLAREAWKARAAFHPLTRAGAWRLLGVASVLAGVVCVLLMRNQERIGAIWLLGGVFLGLVFLANFCLARSKRYDSRARPNVADIRPPVLYLRPFKDDATVGRHLGLASFRLTTEEEEIADIVRPIGPLVAVGRPRETLPYPGAERVYIDDSEWQSRVESLLREAALVLVRVGETSGIWWELEQAVKSTEPGRLVLLLPFTHQQYNEFRRQAAKVFPCALPDYQGRRIPSVTIRAVMVFDADWTPYIWPVQQTHRDYWLRAFASLCNNLSFSSDNVFTQRSSPLRLALESTLAPILMRVGPPRS